MGPTFQSPVDSETVEKIAMQKHSSMSRLTAAERWSVVLVCSGKELREEKVKGKVKKRETMSKKLPKTFAATKSSLCNPALRTIASPGWAPHPN